MRKGWIGYGIGIATLIAIAVVPVRSQIVGHTYHWRAPTTGSIATSYDIYVCSPDSNTCHLYSTVQDTFGYVTHNRSVEYVRVVARDATNRTGLRSVASAPYDPGPPGSCARPWR
jgi:hypothetical protein